MRQRESNVVPFPARPARASQAAEDGDAIHSAARAGAAAAEAISDILGAQEIGRAGEPVGSDALAASKTANAGVLWGAVLGVARCHGQIPALAALEHIVERLRQEPHRLITEPQHQPAGDETARAVRALLA